MNIFEFVSWIRKNDQTVGKTRTAIAEYLMTKHLAGVLSSEDVFEWLKEIMIQMLIEAEYDVIENSK